MLGGKISNQDEDDVEDELEAMAKEVVGISSLPYAPSVVKDELPDAPQQAPSEVQKQRWRDRAAKQSEEASRAIAAE